MSKQESPQTKSRRKEITPSELGKLLLKESFKTELLELLDAYKQLPKDEAHRVKAELRRRLELVERGISYTVFEVISSYPGSFERILKQVSGERERQQLRLLNARYTAHFIGISGTYAEEWRTWLVEPFYDPDTEEVYLRIAAERTDGRPNIMVDSAESMLHIVDTILDEIIDNKALMKKEQLTTVQSRLRDIKKTMARNEEKAEKESKRK